MEGRGAEVRGENEEKGVEGKGEGREGKMRQGRVVTQSVFPHFFPLTFVFCLRRGNEGKEVKGARGNKGKRLN